jgi:hypothetical protein
MSRADRNKADRDFFIGIVISGVGVFFSRQDAGLLPAKPDSGNRMHFTAGYLKLSLEQEPTPCFAFLGGNSPLPIRSTGVIILS